MRSAARIGVAFFVMLAAGCSGDDSPTADVDESPTTVAADGSSGCDAVPVVAPGTTDETLVSEGVERAYQLHVPPAYDGSRPFPVVLGLHALTVDHRFVPSMVGFAEMASTHDFIGVAPSGRRAGPTPFWNAVPVADNYDVTFLAQLLDHLESTLCIDTTQILSTGMSNGGQMSSLLACTLGDRIAGIAPIAGVEYLEPCDGPPVPVIAFHGTADPIVLYGGGGLNATTIAAQQYYKGDLPAGLPAPHGVDDSMRLWAEHNGCAPEPEEQQVSPSVRKRWWRDCTAATVLYIIDGAGHTWPGKPVPGFEASFGLGTTEIDASALLFDFFFGTQD